MILLQVTQQHRLRLCLVGLVVNELRTAATGRRTVDVLREDHQVLVLLLSWVGLLKVLQHRLASLLLKDDIGGALQAAELALLVAVQRVVAEGVVVGEGFSAEGAVQSGAAVVVRRLQVRLQDVTFQRVELGEGAGAAADEAGMLLDAVLGLHVLIQLEMAGLRFKAPQAVQGDGFHFVAGGEDFRVEFTCITFATIVVANTATTNTVPTTPSTATFDSCSSGLLPPLANVLTFSRIGTIQVVILTLS